MEDFAWDEEFEGEDPEIDKNLELEFNLITKYVEFFEKYVNHLFQIRDNNDGVIFADNEIYNLINAFDKVSIYDPNALEQLVDIKKQFVAMMNSMLFRLIYHSKNYTLRGHSLQLAKGMMSEIKKFQSKNKSALEGQLEL